MEVLCKAWIGEEWWSQMVVQLGPDTIGGLRRQMEVTEGGSQTVIMSTVSLRTFLSPIVQGQVLRGDLKVV